MKFKISRILENLIKLKGESISSLADALRINVRSIKNYLNGANISPEIRTSLFNYLLTMNYDLFDVLDLEDDSYFYHMSSQGIEGIITTKKSSRYNDFGNAFYLSDSFKTAATYIKVNDNPRIYCFKKEKVVNLNPYIFKDTLTGSIDWVLYIGLNRNKIENPRFVSFLNEKYSKQFKKTKCLAGKIADSLNFEVMDEFFDGFYDISDVKSQLTKANLGMQYAIKDERSANNLQWDDEIILDKGLIELILLWRKNRNNLLKEDNSKLINKNQSDDNYKFNKIIERLINENE